MSVGGRVLLLHLGIVALLFAAQFVLPAYHHGAAARILVLAAFAVGYNVLFGYTGLLSLGHAMFFAAGLYGAGLSVFYLGFGAWGALGLGILSGLLLAFLFGLVALRTGGVAFLIVTLMFAQACFLTTLYFNEITFGDQGFVISRQLGPLDLGLAQFPFAEPAVKYNMALAVFAACFAGSLLLVRSPLGRVLVAIRENEPRTRMLGYDTWRYKLLALVISGAMSAAAGATYALLFSYVGSTFASIQYSIYPLLWTLLGGLGTTIGPLLGTGLMYYLVDVSSGLTSAYLLIVGLALVVLVVWFPKGIMGALRERWLPWLP
ncbi:MAG: branched-chain amino acid ABC transporter permease [Alphaproteobacteria bacterium]|jgi:branched-chain amino acid transport system permease protein|nr:branched-chain amino acid ABC transporter permease [Alphaproteobacteria bacterium]MDP6815091.1 branched-chain amino acid ABC transporter permease [Alphaproteobacteria bacterium]